MWRLFWRLTHKVFQVLNIQNRSIWFRGTSFFVDVHDELSEMSESHADSCYFPTWDGDPQAALHLPGYMPIRVNTWIPYTSYVYIFKYIIYHTILFNMNMCHGCLFRHIIPQYGCCLDQYVNNYWDDNSLSQHEIWINIAEYGISYPILSWDGVYHHLPYHSRRWKLGYIMIW